MSDESTSDGSSDHETDPEVTERLEDDPLDQMAPEDDDVERAWEETDVGEGEAPTS